MREREAAMPIVTAKIGSPSLFIVEVGVSYGLFRTGYAGEVIAREMRIEVGWGISGGNMQGFKLRIKICVRTYFERR
jgi:hypothetical protein